MSHEVILGQTPNCEVHTRDATHVSVISAKAGAAFSPGENVRIDTNGIAWPTVTNIHGIVDPFLKGRIYAGTIFWLCITPKTTVGLRHVWEHPNLPEPQKQKEVEDDGEWDSCKGCYD